MMPTVRIEHKIHDFDTQEEAEGFVSVMRNVWQSPQAASALHGDPQARIVEVVESQEL